MTVNLAGFLDGGQETLFQGAFLSDVVSHVDGEEVAGVDELVYVIEVDVVSVNEVLVLVTQSGNGCIGLLTGLHRNGSHNGVLTVGLVPYRDEMNTVLLLDLEKGLELVHSLVGETVAYAE